MNKMIRTMMTTLLLMVLAGCPGAPTDTGYVDTAIESCDIHNRIGGGYFTDELEPLTIYNKPWSHNTFIDVQVHTCDTCDVPLLEIVLEDGTTLEQAPYILAPTWATYELSQWEVQVLKSTRIDSVYLDGVELDIDLGQSTQVFTCIGAK